MTQRTIFINGLIVLAVFLFALRMWLVNSTPDEPPARIDPPAGVERSIRINADKREWIAIGRGPMLIRAEGSADLGGRIAVPDDNKQPGNSRSLVPGLPNGMLVGKIGENGEPFRIGRISQIAMNETVYLAINDDEHSDNNGFYTVRLSRDLIR